jgi:hypothetical protein
MTWFVFHRLFLLFGGSLSIFLGVKKKNYIIAFLGACFLIFSIHDCTKWPKLVQQYYFISDYKIISAELSPSISSNPKIKSIDKPFFLDKPAQLAELKNQLSRFEAFQPKQPEIIKRFEIKLNTSEGTSFRYELEMTTDQETIASILINEYSYLYLKGEDVCEILYTATNDKFFKN